MTVSQRSMQHNTWRNCLLNAQYTTKCTEELNVANTLLILAMYLLYPSNHVRLWKQAIRDQRTCVAMTTTSQVIDMMTMATVIQVSLT